MSKDADNDKLPVLGNNRNDVFLARLRALLGPLPVGSLIVEIFTAIIPNQRQDRCEEFLRILATRLDQLASDKGSAWGAEQLARPETIALIEEGAIHATRATSEDRIERIANCVANGLTTSERKAVHHKRLLGILGQLDDEEILILHAAANDPSLMGSLRPEPYGRHPAGSEAIADLAEQHAMWEAAWSHLEALHLMDFKIETEDLGRIGDTMKVPVYDAFGGRRGRHEVSRLGQLLLKTIGLSQT